MSPAGLRAPGHRGSGLGVCFTAVDYVFFISSFCGHLKGAPCLGGCASEKENIVSRERPHNCPCSFFHSLLANFQCYFFSFTVILTVL